MPRVPARERASFERTLHRPITMPVPPSEAHPEGMLRPATKRKGAYYAVRFVQPDEGAFRRVLGLDLLSESDRAAAVREPYRVDRSSGCE